MNQDPEDVNDQLVDALEAVRRRLQQTLALVEEVLADDEDAESGNEE